jgi:CRISPR-associated protein Cmr6
MTQRLVPNRIQGLLANNDLPPGHRFRLFLEGWGNQWEMEDQEKSKLNFAYGPAGDLLSALIQRQGELFPEGETVWKAKRASLAPFVTGMGLPHPLENGFAFLDPYGIPYLPGSSVKGVLKRAAEELALFEQDRKGWTVPALWWLMGFESTSAYLVESQGPWKQAFDERLQAPGERDEAHAFLKACKAELEHLSDKRERSKVHHRGALVFLDVFPDPPETPKGKMTRTDILNPHYAPYYQKQKAPADNANPIPNYFLTLPENTRFTFTVLFRPTPSFPPALADRWKSLMEAAFHFAALHLGFGGKTSQGYGRMDGEQALRLSPKGTSPWRDGGTSQRRNEKNKEELGRFQREVRPQNQRPAPAANQGLQAEVKTFEWDKANQKESLERAERLLKKLKGNQNLAKALLRKIPDQDAQKQLKSSFPNLFH